MFLLIVLAINLCALGQNVSAENSAPILCQEQDQSVSSNCIAAGLGGTSAALSRYLSIRSYADAQKLHDQFSSTYEIKSGPKKINRSLMNDFLSGVQKDDQVLLSVELSEAESRNIRLHELKMRIALGEAILADSRTHKVTKSHMEQIQRQMESDKKYLADIQKGNSPVAKITQVYRLGDVDGDVQRTLEKEARRGSSLKGAHLLPAEARQKIRSARRGGVIGTLVFTGSTFVAITGAIQEGLGYANPEPNDPAKASYPLKTRASSAAR